MKPTWSAFADYLATEFPHHREAIEDEALEWSPYPHYFLMAYLLPELLAAARTENAAAASHASSVLEVVLEEGDADLAEAALHSVLEPLAESEDFELTRPYLGTIAADLVQRLRA